MEYYHLLFFFVEGPFVIVMELCQYNKLKGTGASKSWGKRSYRLRGGYAKFK